MKNVRYAKSALQDLQRYGAMARRIERALLEYATGSGAHANNVKRLVGSSASRLRVGDYRAIFEETGDAILITRVRPRGRAYD